MGFILKTGVILTVGFIGLALIDTSTPEEKKARLDKRIAECHQEVGAEYCAEDGYKNQAYSLKKEAEKVELARVEAEEKAKKEAELIAYNNSPEGILAKKISSFEETSKQLCYGLIRTNARFPNKIDFDWGIKATSYPNFASSGKVRVMVVKTGEMMNGLGMMVPFRGVCKFDFYPDKDQSTPGSMEFVEFLI